MKRREFIALFGAAAAAWPVVARAQSPVRHIGVLSMYGENDPETRLWMEAWLSRLGELGWTPGRNIHIDYRWCSGNLAKATTNAREIVALQPDIILASNTPVSIALLHETRTIPVVFATVTDPIGSGLVESIARPGGNFTGFFSLDSSMTGKWIELLKEITPQVARVALIYSPETATYWRYFSEPFEVAARSFAVQPILMPVRNAEELKVAIVAFAKEGSGGLIAMPDTFTTYNRDLIVDLAASRRLPAIYPFRFFAKAGGLLSYGADETELYRNTASYIDRILRGERPGNLPVQVPTKLEMVINLKTAKALGLAIPQSVLLRTNEVIE